MWQRRGRLVGVDVVVGDLALKRLTALLYVRHFVEGRILLLGLLQVEATQPVKTSTGLGLQPQLVRPSLCCRVVAVEHGRYLAAAVRVLRETLLGIRNRWPGLARKALDVRRGER